MRPAPGNLQAFQFVFQSVVDLIAIGYADSAEVLQEFLRMVFLPGLLEFVQDNRRSETVDSGAVQPHVALITAWVAAFVYQHRCFVRLQHMHFNQDTQHHCIEL